LQDPPKFAQVVSFGLKIHMSSGNPDCDYIFKWLKWLWVNMHAIGERLVRLEII
jgi:hypothetical protein